MHKMITLYINPLTVNSIKTILLCNALEIDVSYQYIQLHKGEQHKKQFKQINPEAQVPVLVDGDFVLSESNAILQYLAAKHKSSLWPQCEQEQAKVLSLLFWQANYFAAAISPYAHRRLVLPHWGLPAGEISSDMQARSHQALTALERMLAQADFLLGKQLTIADISVVSFFIFAEQAGLPLEAYKSIQDWLDKLSTSFWFDHSQRLLQNILLTQAEVF
ncbi:glutathione S-transferase family protein [Agaribacterium sp. ZY112]|uniref:glutathione S-transferase family protein n=1 Tax=Agaribacterium sp. ZY112 TaxID=3233574 RepID=UPI0035261B56